MCDVVKRAFWYILAEPHQKAKWNNVGEARAECGTAHTAVR